MPPETQKPLGRGARIGRRVAQVGYFAFAGFFAAASVVQITRQVFFPERPVEPPFATCREGLVALHGAVERGRHEAERGPVDDDEEAALRRYRAAVFADWRHRDAVAGLCASDPREISVLDAIERLRYSEEHGVRHQAVELTALRLRVQELLAKPER